jgi:hypothetical protein
VNYNPGEPKSAALALYADLVASDLEFVEIHNPGAAGVDLTGWRLRGGADYNFSAGLSIGPGKTLLVISFNPTDPANADRLNAFRAHYGLGASVELVGGYSGQLDNGGEAIRLEQPDQPPVDDPTNIPHAVSDLVIYDDLNPWPLTADGGGDSLQRKSPIWFANAADTWSGAEPSPGTVSFVPLAGDFTGDGAVDLDDVNQLATAVNDGLTADDFDVDENGVVDRQDVFALVQSMGGLVGDANLDGTVNATDLNQVGLHWLHSNCVGWGEGDFTGDGAVTAGDLNMLGLNWLQAAGPRAARSPRAALGLVGFPVDGLDAGRTVSTYKANGFSANNSNSMSLARDAVPLNRRAVVTRDLAHRRGCRPETNHSTTEFSGENYAEIVDDLLANWGQ